MSSQQDNPPTSESDTGLKVWSCIICRRRKIRCDRRDPCANCIRSNIDCHYPVTGRIPRRSRDPTAWKSPSQKQSELLSRLRRLETVVTELAAQVEDGSHNPLHTAASSGAGSSSITDEQTTTASQEESGSSKAPTVSTEPGSEFDEEFGRLVIDKGGSLHVGNRFWSVFCNEVDNILEAVHDVADVDESRNSAIQELGIDGDDASSLHQGLLFNHPSPIPALNHTGPTPSQVDFAWQTYIERVDPFIKVIHVPTVDKILKDLNTNSDHPDPGIEALIFAISLAAVISLNNDEITSNFDISKEQLLVKCKYITERALAKANFMTTKDIPTVQAFVIYLSILPYIEGDDLVWPLTGLLLRIAKSLGLHQEQNSDQIDKIKDETRRRLWWQICFIDSRSQKSKISDVSISAGSFSTKFPRNISDSDLGAHDHQVNKTKASEITLCLIRCEIWKLVQALRAPSATNFQARLHTFHEVKRRIEKNHLSGLDPNKPFDAFTKTMASLFFAKVQLVIYRRQSHHRRDSDTHISHHAHQDTTLSTFGPALDVIEAVHALQTEPSWKPWRWQLQGQVPWHALGIFLQQACYRPWDPVLERGWTLTFQLIESIPEYQKTGKLWEQLKVMFGACQMRREVASTRLSGGSPISPGSPFANPALALGSHTARAETPISYITINPHSGATGSGSLTPDWQPVPKSSPGAGTSSLSREVNFSEDWANVYQSPTSVEASSFEPTAQTERGTTSNEPDYSTGLVDPDSVDWHAWDQLVEMDFAWDFIAF